MKCCICLKSIKKDKKIFKCEKCNNSTHLSCYFYWIKEKGYQICPYCKSSNNSNLIDYRIQVEDLSDDEITTSSSEEFNENELEDYQILINQNNVSNRIHNAPKFINYCILGSCFLTVLIITFWGYNYEEKIYNNTVN